MTTKSFVIEKSGNVVAWAILGRLQLEEVIESITEIKEAVSATKKANGSVKIIVDNSYMAEEGVNAFPAQIAEKWGELQMWFVNTLDENDKIAVIQARVTMKMQMTRLGKEIGLDKIETHFCEKTYEETKQKAYQYLGITSSNLIDSAKK